MDPVKTEIARIVKDMTDPITRQHPTDLEIEAKMDAYRIQQSHSLPNASQYLAKSTVYRSEPQAGFEERGTEEQLASLYAALAEARGQFGEIVKSSTVEVRMNSGGKYTFSYAPMETLLKATVPALSKNGLLVMLPFSRVEPEACVQWAIIAHKGGGRLVFSYPFAPNKEIKTFGGDLTYYQRYAYRSALSLAADADLDEMPEEARGETSAQKVAPQAPQARANPAPSQPQRPQEPVKNRTPPTPEPADSAGDAKHAARVKETQDALRSIGARTLSEGSVFAHAAIGKVKELGSPFLSKCTPEELDKICEAVVKHKMETP
jgi:hypothetical protein